MIRDKSGMFDHTLCAYIYLVTYPLLLFSAEVEHAMTATQEMNVNLQSMLEKALNTQKQSNATTTHVVRNIQSDLTRVSLFGD